MRTKRLVTGLLAASLIAAGIGWAQTPPQTMQQEPIAFIGHGAIFDSSGKEINVTPQFIKEAQQYYLNSLYNQAAPALRAKFDSKRQSLFAGNLFASDLQKGGQSELLANSLLLDYLVKEVKPLNAGALAGKLNMLKQLLRTRRLSTLNQPISSRDVEIFAPPNNVQDRLKQQGLSESKPLFLATKPANVDYINQCKDAGVPIPPDWGDSKWISKGVLENEFISSDREAEVFTYDSTAPEGVCIALPRFNSARNVIELLGIICLGKISSKVCFWDNQQDDVQFDIPKGTVVSLTSFSGGPELDGGTGGVCTDCHAGENPYIIHPKTNLGLPNLRGLKLRADNWYQPLVHPNWPQNPGPSNILDSIDSIGQCTDCHTKTGSGGRFPKISTMTPGYCGAVLKNAIAKTMPPGNPGDPDYIVHVNALLAACTAPPE